MIEKCISKYFKGVQKQQNQQQQSQPQDQQTETRQPEQQQHQPQPQQGVQQQQPQLDQEQQNAERGGLINITFCHPMKTSSMALETFKETSLLSQTSKVHLISYITMNNNQIFYY